MRFSRNQNTNSESQQTKRAQLALSPFGLYGAPESTRTSDLLGRRRGLMTILSKLADPPSRQAMLTTAEPLGLEQLPQFERALAQRVT
jgi:hypothetical protein